MEVMKMLSAVARIYFAVAGILPALLRIDLAYTKTLVAGVKTIRAVVTLCQVAANSKGLEMERV